MKNLIEGVKNLMGCQLKTEKFCNIYLIYAVKPQIQKKNFTGHPLLISVKIAAIGGASTAAAFTRMF